MSTLKLPFILLGVAVLGLAAFGAFRAVVQLSTRRETSEVIRMLSDREVTGFQIAWSVIGLVSIAVAVFLLVRAWRTVFTQRHDTAA